MIAVRRTLVTATLILGSAACVKPAAVAVPTDTSGSFLYVWTESADTAKRAAFISVIDLRAGSPDAGKVVRAVYAGPGSRSVHHTEHSIPADGLLFANDFGTGRTYIYDMNKPGEPRVAASFGTAGPFGWPHSYARLPNGNRLATYQWQSTKFNTPPGGIAEVRPDGSVVRWVSAATADAEDREITPYSLEVIPSLDRAVSTTTSMIEDTGVHVQIWRISDLTLLHTLRIPASTHAKHGPDSIPHHMLPGEPRLLSDGRTVMMGTFMCGVFIVTGIDTPAPGLKEVHAFPGESCAMPVVTGNYWIQTVPELRAVVALDVSDPANPREVSRVVYEGLKPHWLAGDLSGRRLVMNAGSPKDPNLYLIDFDPATGALTRNMRFESLSVAAVDVPGIGTVKGVPHGAVFSR
ncbi:MAG: hypothetical protein ACR2GK_13095 [Gemmatimonadaceae bacterium]